MSFGGKHEEVAKAIGITLDQYFKRLRVARLIAGFPEALDHLRAGRTCVSHLALVYPKITPANQAVIWEHVLGRGRREVESFLRRVWPNGTVSLEEQDLIPVTLHLTADQEASLRRLTDGASEGTQLGALRAHFEIFRTLPSPNLPQEDREFSELW